MPRHPMPKKNASVLKLEGGYRKDRHENRDESALTTMLTTPPPCPTTLKTEHARQAWAIAIPPLAYTSRIGKEDLPILEVAFQALDGANIFQARLDEMMSITIEEILAEEKIAPDNNHIMQLAGMVKNYRAQFVEIMRRFGATSQDRLTLLDVMAGVQRKQNLAEKMTE